MQRDVFRRNKQRSLRIMLRRSEFKLACVQLQDFRTEERISELLQSPEHGGAVQEERDTKARRQTVKSHTSSSSSGVSLGTPTASFRHKPSPVSPARSITPEVIQVGLLIYIINLLDLNSSLSSAHVLTRSSE